MPLYAFRCGECGRAGEQFCHTAADQGAAAMLCGCGSTMAPVLSMGRGLTYFEENRPRTLWNLGPEPVTVRSHEEHKRVMRERNVEWATGWSTQGRGGWV